MILQIYIRTKINQFIKPIFIKNNCEVCNSDNDLELHHIILFSDLIEECHKKLNIEPKKYKSDYSELELENIINWMLGIHLQIPYLTLCKNCHKQKHEFDKMIICCNDKHKNYYSNNRIKQDIQRKIYVENILIPFLDSIVENKLFNSEQKELIDKIDLRVNGKQQKSISKLNSELKILRLPYVLLSKKSNNIRYWKVVKN